jgi:cell division protein DivIC
MAKSLVNPFSPLIKKVPSRFQNRYTLILGVFVIWMLLFDRHDVLTNFKLQRTVNKLESDKIYYQHKIDETKQERIDMENNREKFAREHYFMKAKDEDIFVVDSSSYKK